jgi:protein MpaA
LGPLLPAAKRETASGKVKAAQLHAPEPTVREGENTRDPEARTVSGFERPIIVDSPSWSGYYRSTERRPIKSMVLGNGPRHVAIMASMHGDEFQSVALVEELARCLKQNPEYLSETTLLLVKSPNPDGSFRKSPYNSRGIDLNRNFPAANWAPLENRRAGSQAGSEAETKAIVRLLSEFKPQLLVHVKDSRTTGFINFEGTANDRAEQIASLISCQVMQGRGSRTTGSVESYALNQLRCPSLTLLLPREDASDAAWTANRDALLSVLGPVPNKVQIDGPEDDEVTNSIREQPDPFDDAAVRGSSRKQQAPLRNTTKTHEKSRLPEFPAPVPEHGYLELPAP